MGVMDLTARKSGPSPQPTGRFLAVIYICIPLAEAACCWPMHDQTSEASPILYPEGVWYAEMLPRGIGAL